MTIKIFKIFFCFLKYNNNNNSNIYRDVNNIFNFNFEFFFFKCPQCITFQVETAKAAEGKRKEGIQTSPLYGFLITNCDFDKSYTS